MRTALAAFISTVLALMLAVNALADDATQVCPSTKCAESKVFAPVSQTPAAGTTAVQYVIKCELTRVDADGNSKPLAAPTIVLSEGHEGQISVQGERPFVTGVRRTTDGTTTPVVTKLSEGLTGRFTVTSLDSETVHVDASISQQSIDEVEEIVDPASEGDALQAPVQCSTGWRVVRAVSIGESITVLGKPAGAANSEFTIKFKVDRLSADEAAITPIRAAESEATERAPLVWNTYNVVDLLEPDAQVRGIDKLSDADFVPLVDLVISEALVEWPDDAVIRPDAEYGRLVINQTQEAHLKIGQLLRDKRDNIAAVKRLIK
jgi:hypothetical protein